MNFRLLLLLLGAWCLWTGNVRSQDAVGYGGVRIISITNKVWHIKAGGVRHEAVLSSVVERTEGLRTEEGAEARIRWPNGSETQLGEYTTLYVMGENTERSSALLMLWEGVLRKVGFGKSRLDFLTPHAFGGALGTDFVIRVDTNKSTFVFVHEGMVEVGNSNRTYQRVELGPESGAEIDNINPPRVFSFAVTNEVQWWLHYPAILDPAELKLSPEEQARLAASLAAWRLGNVRDAWSAFPQDLVGGSPDARLYWGALQMAAGLVSDARSVITNLADSPAVAGHRWMIAAFAHEPVFLDLKARSATEHLGLSYLFQDRHLLPKALDEAKQATTKAPALGFAWARRAELEFSLGDSRAARDSLALALAPTNSPEHAPAHSLLGFVLAAENDPKGAAEEFDRARTIDPLLSDGWLGSGLLKYRRLVRSRGVEATNGLAQLRLAASLATNRSQLRSYLGKAYAERHDMPRAFGELDRAKSLDPKDPTPWLYSALTLYSENRVNEAIVDLEHSLALNDNRAVYRSRLLLDEDRAIRGTGLARLYQRAGLTDVSLREASRAVASDYANYSSHLFLAETYDALRDPTRFNLRYDTAWLNELLLADLLAPVGAGTFSPNVSQQEYTRLFTSEGLALATVTDLRSDGQFHQLATQSGFFGRTAWSLDVDYQHNDGVRPNNSLDRVEWYSHIKQQVTPQDTALLLVKFQDYHSGDNFQYLDPLRPANGYSPSFRYDESEKPIAVAGWRHEWKPGFQLLALAGRLENDQQFQRDGARLLQSVTSNAMPPSRTDLNPQADVEYRGRFEIYTAELSQIAQFESERFGQHTLVFGGRFQSGDFTTDYRLNDTAPGSILSVLYPGEMNQDRTVRADFQRESLYAYETWAPLRSLVLTAGIAYDDVHFPANFRHPPLQTNETSEVRIQPKAALVWTPHGTITLRGMYAKSLGGVSLDESYRLEPVQLAGFGQAFRTLIPESIAGSVSAPGFDVGGVALDLKLPSRIYLGLRGDILRSDVDQQIGIFEASTPANSPLITSANVGQTSEQLRFSEDAMTVTLDKLLGDEWSIGGSHRFQTSRLDDRLPSLGAFSTRRAKLHEFALRTGWNHAAGWFGRAEARWLLQEHWSAAAGIADGDEDACQVNVQVGWRFPRQRGEVSAGILNLLGDDYRLDPLSGLPEFARERVFFGRLKLNF